MEYTTAPHRGLVLFQLVARQPDVQFFERVQERRDGIEDVGVDGLLRLAPVDLGKTDLKRYRSIRNTILLMLPPPPPRALGETRKLALLPWEPGQTYAWAAERVFF